VNNILKILLIFYLFTGCSFPKKTNLWNKEKVIKEKQQNINEIFNAKEILSEEFNPNLKIRLYSKVTNGSYLQSFDNNNARTNYNGNLQSFLKYKFKKIKNFSQYEPEISFNQKNIIFFDNKGYILNFDYNSNLIWKKNYYSKSEIKQNPILFFAQNSNILIIADNVAKLYALDTNTGDLLWEKKNTAPFNSQIKIYKNKLYVIDFENTLRAYSLNDGKEIWNNKTQSSLIRSHKKLSLVIVKEIIYFNNSLGDLSAVDINTGDLLWQIPTQSNYSYDAGFFLKMSDIVADKETLFFSNNQNEFFSIDIKTGNLNWKQEINSDLRPTIINNFIFTVSIEGYLIVIEKISGNIIRANDIFGNFKDKKRSKIKPSGFIVGIENIYLSTDSGQLLIIDINNGKIKSTLKIDNNKISRPVVVNQNLYVITDNSITKFD
jgi:outer membrane protein assembly factor BamB